MLGAWCGSWGYNFPDDGAGRYFRTDDVGDCAHHGGMQVRKDGWDYYRFDDLKGSCELTSIRRPATEARRVARPSQATGATGAATPR